MVKQLELFYFLKILYLSKALLKSMQKLVNEVNILL
jgi:hypothetical protein